LWDLGSRGSNRAPRSLGVLDGGVPNALRWLVQPGGAALYVAGRFFLPLKRLASNLFRLPSAPGAVRHAPLLCSTLSQDRMSGSLQEFSWMYHKYPSFKVHVRGRCSWSFLV